MAKISFHYLDNIILFFNLAWRMFHANNTFGSYHRFVGRVAGTTIKQSLLLNDKSIHDSSYKKIRWYMVEAIVMGEMLSNLVGYNLNKRERESLIYLGAIMALYDVIVDEFRLDRDIVNRILENTFRSGARPFYDNETAIEKVLYFYLDKLTGTIEKESWDEISGYLNIIKLQTDSDVQYNRELSEVQIKEITQGKGGASALICSAFLRHKSDSLKAAIFQMGGFIQMMNDCQDIYKDTVSGIKTYLHFCRSFTDIFNRLNEERIKTFRLIKTLDFPEDKVYKTLFDLNAMFIVISFKLESYSGICNYRLDFNAIAGMDKRSFRLNPFSLKSLWTCTPKILQFRSDSSESVQNFKFE
jgi:hypothetical protein